MLISVAALCAGTLVMAMASNMAVAKDLPANRKLHTIFNNDINNILGALDPEKPAQAIIEDYRRALVEILEAKPGVFAQNVGMPDPVIYRSKAATSWSKYVGGPEAEAMRKMLDAGADPFTVTIEECRRRGIPVVASYRMNAEDFYERTTDIDDFGRENKHLAIPGANCLDPAHPKVYSHRMAIFREVAEEYDIDGIELDFRRWTHMVSDPLNNYPVLTRMVADTRRILDEVAKKKERKRLILGVRVGPSLDTPFAVAKYPGSVSPEADPSCKELGLDVKTWIDEGLVDYVCPTLFWPRWPGHPYTKEFVALAKGKNIGIYPTLFPLPAWLEEKGSEYQGPIEPGDTAKLRRYKDEICDIALKMYDDGADGISTYNWYFHLHLAKMPNQWQAYYGYGMGGSALQKHFLSILGNPKAIRKYRKAPGFWPAEPIRLVNGPHLFIDDDLIAESKGLTRTTHQPHKLAGPVPPSGTWDQRPSAPHWASYDALAAKELPDNLRLGSIFNSDIDGLLYSSSGKDTSPAEYKQMVRSMLGYGMKVLAQNVGMPDPVIYRTKVATTWDKYITEVCMGQGWTRPGETDWSGDALKTLLAAGADPLQLTIEACRERGVFIVASYRMNAEDFYTGELDLSDFDRQHKHLAIPGANCLDPAHPEVYAHRMTIFREVADNYDTDGIEFDFRRWTHMVSDPLKNHAVLTKMVAETRQMLDEVARKKGRKRLLLGVRVAGSLDTPENAAKYPGAISPGADPSCKELGLDVKTWIANGDVDYVCPSLFWPRLPGLPYTKEFVALAKGKNIGIYPTVFPLPGWAEKEKIPVYDSLDARRRHKDEIVKAALQCYEDGAHGISTYNWNRNDPDRPVGKKHENAKVYGRGCEGYSRVSIQVHRNLHSPAALKRLLAADPPNRQARGRLSNIAGR